MISHAWGAARTVILVYLLSSNEADKYIDPTKEPQTGEAL
jgi:hypothetical protein